MAYDRGAYEEAVAYHQRCIAIWEQIGDQRGMGVSWNNLGNIAYDLGEIARLFGEAEVLTWVMTASLAVTLVLCAHGLGTFLRQPHPSMAERRWVMVLITLPVLAIFAIALIRARYLAVAAELTGLDTLGPLVGSAAFLIINLLVYTGATMLSYLAHAPKDRAAEERAAQKQQMAVAQQELTFATRRVREQEGRVSRSAVASEQALRSMRAQADQVIAYYRGLMAAYSTANMRARGNPEVPDALRTLPAIEVPEVLRERNQSLERKLKELVDVARANDALADRIHRLCQRLIRAHTLPETINAVETSLREDFDAMHSVLVLFLESAKALEPDAARFLRTGSPTDADIKTFETLLQSGKPRCGRYPGQRIELCRLPVRQRPGRRLHQQREQSRRGGWQRRHGRLRAQPAVPRTRRSRHARGACGREPGQLLGGRPGGPEHGRDPRSARRAADGAGPGRARQRVRIRYPDTGRASGDGIADGAAGRRQRLRRCDAAGPHSLGSRDLPVAADSRGDRRVPGSARAAGWNQQPVRRSARDGAHGRPGRPSCDMGPAAADGAAARQHRCALVRGRLLPSRHHDFTGRIACAGGEHLDGADVRVSGADRLQ
jgi:hypothetical protein